jgi:hypothetical protein
MLMVAPTEPRAPSPPAERGRSVREADRVGVKFNRTKIKTALISAKVSELQETKMTPTRRWRADLPLSGGGNGDTG